MTARRMHRRPRHEVGSTNVYADLGVPDAADMMVKAQLVTEIADIIAERGCTQAQAAAILGLTQPKLSRLLRGHFSGFSERKLMDCLTCLGRDVQIVVRPTPKSRTQGAVSVRFC